MIGQDPGEVLYHAVLLKAVKGDTTLEAHCSGVTVGHGGGIQLPGGDSVRFRFGVAGAVVEFRGKLAEALRLGLLAEGIECVELC